MKQYIIRINCGCYEDITVEAENEEQAIEQAQNEFSCFGDTAEYGETIEGGK